MGVKVSWRKHMFGSQNCVFYGHRYPGSGCSHSNGRRFVVTTQQRAFQAFWPYECITAGRYLNPLLTQALHISYICGVTRLDSFSSQTVWCEREKADGGHEGICDYAHSSEAYFAQPSTLSASTTSGEYLPPFSNMMALLQPS